MKRGIAFAVVALCAIAGAPSARRGRGAGAEAGARTGRHRDPRGRARDRRARHRHRHAVPREEILVAPEIEGLRITEVLVEEGDVGREGRRCSPACRATSSRRSSPRTRRRIARADAAIAQARSQIIQAEAAQVEAAQALERARALMKRRQHHRGRAGAARLGVARGAEGRLAAARDGAADGARPSGARAEAQRPRDRGPPRPHGDQGAAGRDRQPQERRAIGATATAAGEPLFRIIANGEIELEGEVTETQLVRIREGAPAQVAIDPGRVVDGRVRNVFPEVDRATPPRARAHRSAEGSGAAHRRVRPRHGRARAPHRRRGAALVRRSTAPRARRVQVVVDDKVQTRRVRTGLSADGFVQIEEGVAAGELGRRPRRQLPARRRRGAPGRPPKTAQAEGAR